MRGFNIAQIASLIWSNVGSVARFTTATSVVDKTSYNSLRLIAKAAWAIPCSATTGQCSVDVNVGLTNPAKMWAEMYYYAPTLLTNWHVCGACSNARFIYTRSLGSAVTVTAHIVEIY